MPISDLSLVSQSLKDLLKQHINNTLASSGSPVDVQLGYPEERVGASRTINLHLYHVAEDQFNSNFSGRGADRNQVATNPMTLSLFYILTSHHNGSKRAEVEQEIMGHALKTLHDFAIIGADSQVVDSGGNSVPVLAPPLGDAQARLEIILRPLTPEDALNYWASEQQQAVRLAAYYEVRLVQLQPETPKSADGIVLTVGHWVGPTVDVQLDRAQSSISFAHPPSIAGTLPSVIDISPARPFLDQPPFVPAFSDTNKFIIFGRNLAGGMDRRLVVARDGWEEQGVPGGEIALEAAQQSDLTTDVWGLGFYDNHVDVGIARSIVYIDAGGASQSLAVVPGDYRACVDIVLHRRSNDGHEVKRRSAWVTFQIAARIRDNVAASSGRRRIRLHPTIDFSASDQEVSLVVDGKVYERVSGFSGTLADDKGKFTVASESVTLQPDYDAVVAGLHPVRLSLNGADCQPYWIETP